MLRDGEEQEVAARELVPGDVVLLEAGARVPADARVTESVNLKVDEAALTGESLPVRKTQRGGDRRRPRGRRPKEHGLRRHRRHLRPRDRRSWSRPGCARSSGRSPGCCKAWRAGRTPLQENLDRVGHVLARAALAVVALIVVLGILRGQSFWEMLIFGIALAVAVVPEALPGGGDDLPRSGRPADGEAQRAGASAVGRGDARERLGHRFRQDRHADPGRDDRPADPRRRAERWTSPGRATNRHGEFSEAGRRSHRRRRSWPCCRRLPSPPTPGSSDAERRAGGWSAKGDPTELALIVAAEKAGLHKHRARRPLTRAWPRSRSPPRPSG